MKGRLGKKQGTETRKSRAKSKDPKPQLAGALGGDGLKA